MQRRYSGPDLNLGQSDAWAPSEESRLEECFVKTTQFDDIHSDDYTFLCGRRGTGKSAIARMLLLENSDYALKKICRASDSSYDQYCNVITAIAFQKSMGLQVDVKQTMKGLWRWLLPVTVMQIISEKVKNRQLKRTQDTDAIQSYLIEALKPPLHSESTFGVILSDVFGRAVSSLSTGSFYTYILHLADEAQFIEAKKAVGRLLGKHKTLLVFDSLESYKIFQEEMVEGFQGILQAVLGFLEDNDMHNVSLKLFLPAEVWQRITAAFPSKITTRTVFTRWGAADLITILARRYLMVIRRTGVLAKNPSLIDKLEQLIAESTDAHKVRILRENFWYQTGFLPRSITNTLGHEEDCFAFMLRHSFRRPRDLIVGIMQSVLNKAVDGESFPYITGKNVIEGVHTMKTLGMIVGDALTPYEAKVTDEFLRASRTMLQGRPAVMNGKELRIFAKELYSISNLENVTPSTFPEQLLQCGVIGLVIDQTTKASKVRYCKGKFEYMMSESIALADRSEYCVHPAMADAFGMTISANRGAVYPLPEDDTWLESVAGIIEA